MCDRVLFRSRPTRRYLFLLTMLLLVPGLVRAQSADVPPEPTTQPALNDTCAM